MKNTRDIVAWFITFEELAIREGLCLGHIDHTLRDAGRKLFDQGYNAGAAVAKLKLDQEKLSDRTRTPCTNQIIQSTAAEQDLKNLAGGNPSDSTALFFPTRNEIKYPANAQEQLSARPISPLKVQELEVSRHGYEGWDTYAIRTKENYCLAVVGEVDRATSEINKQAALLFAAAPELLAGLEALFEHCSMVHSRWGDGSNQKEADAAIKTCREAISKAKGEVSK